MHDEMGRLVDEEKILVFGDNGKFRRLEAEIDLESYPFSARRTGPIREGGTSSPMSAWMA